MPMMPQHNELHPPQFLFEVRRHLPLWINALAHRQIENILRNQLLQIEEMFDITRISCAEEDEDEEIPAFTAFEWTPELIACMRINNPNFEPHVNEIIADTNEDANCNGDNDVVSPQGNLAAKAEPLGPRASSNALLTPAQLASEAWSAKSSRSKPHGINLLHLWIKCLRDTFDGRLVTVDENAEVEMEGGSPSDDNLNVEPSSALLVPKESIVGRSYARCFLPHWWSQLTCGLYLPTAFLQLLRLAPSYLASKPNKQQPCNPLQHHFLNQLQIRTPFCEWILPSLSIAISRLMPVVNSLRSSNTLWVWHNLDGFLEDRQDRVAGIHITPVIVPWPTITTLENLVLAIRANPICDDVRDPFRRFLMDAANASCGCRHDAGCLKAAGGSSQSEAVQQMLQHLQIVRGCLWWKCDWGAHLISVLALSLMGLSQASLIDEAPSIDAVQQRRSASAWGDFFATCSLPPASLLDKLPPSVTVSRILGSHPAASLLSDALPWSLGIVTHAGTFEPHASCLLAPLSRGFVGGFIGSSVGPGGW